MDPPITRRHFAKLSAGAAVAAALPAWAPAAEAGSLQGLRGRLGARVLTPSSPGWAKALALHNPRLNRGSAQRAPDASNRLAPPRAIVFCRSTADVALVLAYAHARRLPVAARGGRHSFAGYCNAPGGIVADVSQLRGVAVRGDRVRIGGGATVLDVYREVVLEHGLSLPVGTCPTVGITGLALGGGFGRLMRRRGVTADSLRAATVVLASGRVVRCDAHRHADLFWALRGGGAGYGIVTETEFAVRREDDPLTVTLSFDWAKAAAALDAWQRTLPLAGSRLAYGRFRALRRPDGRLTATVGAHFYGSEAELRTLLAPLLAAGPSRTTIKRAAFADAALPDACRRVGETGVTADVRAYPNYQRSDFFARALPPEAIATLLRRIEAWPGGGSEAHEGGVQLDALGGAVNAVDPAATAFPHRRALFHLAYLSLWGPADDATANAQWVRDCSAEMRPYATGAAFSNYIDAELADGPSAYYGPNLPRLRRIARKYDPKGRLAFAQGTR